jgi:hypothetical protein
MDERGAVRIGDSERRATIDALTAHREAGRLDPTEFEDRQVAASRARTWSEIAPLFADLPEPLPVGMPTGLSAAPVTVPPASVQVPGQRLEPVHGVLDGLVPPRHRDTVMALTPFVAVLLFFVTKSWMWFLAIPIMGILLYGPDGNRRQRRKR